MLINFLPILLMVALITSFVKLSAYIYKRTILKWSHALIYTSLFAVLLFLVGVTNKALGSPLPLVVGIALSLTIQVLLAGWYLGPRAVTKDGDKLAFKRGAMLGAISYITTVGAVAVPALIYFTLSPSGSN